MSYSFDTPCSQCKRVDTCTDRHLIQGAINGIHSMPVGKSYGHQGSGRVYLECDNFEQVLERPKEG